MNMKLALLLILGLTAGCGPAEKPVEKSAPANEPIEINEAPPPPLGEDDHPEHGPHEGALIELGKEEYHAELVHDEKAGTVTVYLLDSAAKKSVPVEAGEVTMHLNHDGKPEQFKLTASREQSDPEGQSSRFVSSDTHLAEALDQEHAEARLVVVIKGKVFAGKVPHHHHD